MRVTFEGNDWVGHAIVSDEPGPDGWWHVHLIVRGKTEVAVIAGAKIITEHYSAGRDFHLRVPIAASQFEPCYGMTRFSFRTPPMVHAAKVNDDPPTRAIGLGAA